MKIIAKKKMGTFVPAPAGAHRGVLADVVDLGETENRFKPGTKVHQVRWIWQIEEELPDDGPRFTVTKFYTLSLHEKANLRQDIESLLGRSLTEEEEGDGIDLENFLGMSAMLSVVHVDKGEKGIYANVAAIMPLPKGTKPLEVRDYVRLKDREDSPYYEPF